MAEEILIKCTLNQDMLSRAPNQRVLVRLDIEPGPALQLQEDVACDICLVLDCSSSMDEPFSDTVSHITKRQGAMLAAKAVLPSLGPQDTISIVFYASQAYHIATALPASKRAEIENHIDSLSRFNGGTNFEAALTMTQQVLNSCQNLTKRVLFLTDGNANEGSAIKVESQINELTKQGVVMDCMGIGKDFNFTYMRSLSTSSNGFTELLDSPDRASNIFQNLLINTQRTVAQHVFLNLMIPAGVRDLEFYQHLPEMRYYAIKPGQDGVSRLELNIQTLRRDRRNIYILKANLDAPAQDNNQLLAEVRLDFDIPSLKLKAQRVASNVFVNYTDQNTHPLRDTSVDDLYYEAELTKLYAQFIEIKEQDWQKAVSLLQEMIARAHMLDDKERISLYQRALQILQKDKKLSNDDLNRMGQSSSCSTQQGQADITLPAANHSMIEY